MAKDVLLTLERERRAAQERQVSADIEVVVEGYQRRIREPELKRIERDRQALRERLFAAG